MKLIDHSTIRKIGAFVLAGIIVLSLAACGVQIKSADSSDTSASGQATAPADTSGTTTTTTTESSDSPTATGGDNSAGMGTAAPTPSPSPEPALPPVRAVIFDTTVNTSLPVEGQGGGVSNSELSIKLTLYETTPGIFEGEGTLSGVTDNQFSTTKSHITHYYRTGSLSLKPGEEKQVGMLVAGFMHTEQAVDLSEDIGWFAYDKNNNEQGQYSLTLSIDGDTARLTLKPIKAVDTNSTVFEGKVTELPPPGESAPFTAPTDKVIYINSTFISSDDGYERRAILTVTPSADGTYSGKLCVYSAGKRMPYADDTVNFKLSAFNEDAYQAAGGKLSGNFDAFGVVQGSGAGYIVLMDGDRPLVEPVGSDMAFFGSLLPLEQADTAIHEAEETKQLMKTLYDGASPSIDMNGFLKQFQGKDMTDPTIQKAIQDFLKNTATSEGKPAWYPDWLLPKPVKLYDDGSYRENKDAGGSISSVVWYRAQYEENLIINDVYASYTSQMSGMEGYDVVHDSNKVPDIPSALFENAYIVFKKGVYSIEISLWQGLGYTLVEVSIV